MTGQGVNPKKSVAFKTTGEQPAVAELEGQTLPLQEEIRIAGAGRPHHRYARVWPPNPEEDSGGLKDAPTHLWGAGGV